MPSIVADISLQTGVPTVGFEYLFKIRRPIPLQLTLSLSSRSEQLKVVSDFLPRDSSHLAFGRAQNEFNKIVHECTAKSALQQSTRVLSTQIPVAGVCRPSHAPRNVECCSIGSNTTERNPIVAENTDVTARSSQPAAPPPPSYIAPTLNAGSCDTNRAGK
jgi:hypothetical protein